MESTSVFSPPSGQSVHRRRSRQKRKASVPSFLRELLYKNYCLAVWLKNWREETFLNTAIRITCFELFFLSISVSCILYPRLKKIEDVYSFGILAGFLLYVSCYFMFEKVGRLMKNLGIESRFRRETGGVRVKNRASILAAALIFLALMGVFAVLTAKTAYNYHTRYFWWNH
jgi:hypothetical protein